MKDYSFGDKEYRKQFILNSYVTEDYGYIIVRFADGRTEKLTNTWKNHEMLFKRKEEQIQKAYETLHHSTIDYSDVNIFESIRRYIAIKTKAKDIDKNKIWLDSLDYINRALAYNKSWVLGLSSLYVQDCLIWGKLPLTLDHADKFSLKDVNEMLNRIDFYAKRYVKFPKRNNQEVSE